jgi:hypothetical protein
LILLEVKRAAWLDSQAEVENLMVLLVKSTILFSKVCLMGSVKQSGWQRLVIHRLMKQPPRGLGCSQQVARLDKIGTLNQMQEIALGLGSPQQKPCLLLGNPCSLLKLMRSMHQGLNGKLPSTP